VNTTGASLLHLNLLKTAVGGSSAGGNLAAIMCQKAASLPPSSSNLVPNFLTQLLVVPVTNNTASTFNNVSWKENKYSPALPAAKMMWYRNHYLPDEKTWSQPEASPLLWTGNWGALPNALVVVGEMDVLRSEGEEFAEKLWEVGVGADLKIMKGMPHPFLAMDGVLQQGRDTITFMVGWLREAFETK
jgi:acetyl esterase/lipase